MFLGVVVIVAVIIVVIVGKYFVVPQQNASEIALQNAIAFQNIDFAKETVLCNNFEDITYLVSCSEAVELALGNVIGTVTNIELGQARILYISETTREKREAEAWLIYVRADTGLSQPDLESGVQNFIVAIGVDNPSTANIRSNDVQ